MDRSCCPILVNARAGTFHNSPTPQQLQELAQEIGLRAEIVPTQTAEEMCHYVDVRDVARMFQVVAEHPLAVGEIFNCAGPSPIRGTEFIQIIQRICPGIQVEVGFPWSMAQGGDLAFDMSKAKRLLGFEPLYTMEQSIRSIKDWVDIGGLNEEPVAPANGVYGAGVGHKR